jgi:hypothetical protein
MWEAMLRIREQPKEKEVDWGMGTCELEKTSYHGRKSGSENNLFLCALFCCSIDSEIFGFSLLLWRHNKKYKHTGTKMSYLNCRKMRKITFILFFLL